MSESIGTPTWLDVLESQLLTLGWDDFWLRSVSDIRVLLSSLPSDLTSTEQLLVRTLVTRVLVSSLRQWQGHARVSVQLLLVKREVGFYDFTRSALELLDPRALERPPDAALAAEVLDIIASRYSDPDLSLSAIAQEFHVSVGHLSRLITLRSGAGFLHHLHRTRVAAAAELLVSTRLSVKEIAAAVGYGSTSALDRQFKRVHRMTPLDCRRSRVITNDHYTSQSSTTVFC